ncbi:MAG: hypothetical protein AAF039_01860 [Bacteroidota bacterium]
MAHKNIRDALSSFEQFEDKEWEKVAPLIEIKTFDKGEFYIQPGQYCQDIAFIEEGLFNYYYMIEGVKHIRQFFFYNNFMSNYPSFLSFQKSKSYIQALEDSRITTISRNNLHKLYNSSMVWQSLGRKMAERMYLTISEKHDSFLLDSPEDRFLKLYSERPKVLMNVPQHMIASFIGVTPEALSRIKKRLFNK